jgi:hypothetical protein
MGEAVADDWIDREPGLAAAGHEVARVLRRARKRPVMTLLVAAGLTAGMVAYQAAKPPKHIASAVLRISEADYYQARASMREGDLVDYVWNAIINKPAILELIDQHGLYPRKLAISADLAVTAFQEDFSVHEYRNYFLASREEGAMRSARLMIEFAHEDVDNAVAIVRDVAQRIIDYETARRRELGVAALAAARAEVDRARAGFEQRQTELMAKTKPLSTDLNSLGQLESRLDVSRTRLEEVELRAAADAENQSLRIEVAAVHRPWVRPRTARFFVALGVALFAVLLTVVAVGVGALDSAIRDPDDVLRIGLPVVGHVPEFAGCRHGSLRDRLAARPPHSG